MQHHVLGALALAAYTLNLWLGATAESQMILEQEPRESRARQINLFIAGEQSTQMRDVKVVIFAGRSGEALQPVDK